MPQPHTPATFWAKADTLAFGCWIWDGYADSHGHTRLKYQGKMWSAPRLAFHLTCGEIPKGLTVWQRCGNRRCVNPAHLATRTHSAALAANGPHKNGHTDQTHCKNGHPLSGDNLLNLTTQRKCKTCWNAYMRLRYQQSKLKASCHALMAD